MRPQLRCLQPGVLLWGRQEVQEEEGDNDVDEDGEMLRTGRAAPTNTADNE